MGRFVDDLEQRGVDLVALATRFVEIERAEHRADVGHHEVDDRELEVRDLVGRLRSVEHLEEHDAVHADHRVVLRDDVLRGHVEHLLHHVHLAPDVLHDRDEEMKAGIERMRVFAPALDGPFVALRHDADELEQHDDGDGDDDKRKDRTHDVLPWSSYKYRWGRGGRNEVVRAEKRFLVR